MRSAGKVCLVTSQIRHVIPHKNTPSSSIHTKHTIKKKNGQNTDDTTTSHNITLKHGSSSMLQALFISHGLEHIRCNGCGNSTESIVYTNRKSLSWIWNTHIPMCVLRSPVSCTVSRWLQNVFRCPILYAWMVLATGNSLHRIYIE